MSEDAIMSEHYTKLTIAGRIPMTGRALTMESGARWFHPDNGSAPIRLLDVAESDGLRGLIHPEI